MFKFVLAAVLGTSALTTNAVAFDHQPTVGKVQSLLRSEDSLEMAKVTDRILAAMFRVAGDELEARGYHEEALKLDTEYAFNAAGYFEAAFYKEDLGDHAAFSAWLQEQYDWLEGILGETTMKFLHLDDIEIVNFAVVVVFHMDKLGEDPISEDEYALHFNPFCGVVAYWGTWIACEVATSGTGWVLVCTPAGVVAENVVYNYVAPKFAPRWYVRMYP